METEDKTNFFVHTFPLTNKRSWAIYISTTDKSMTVNMGESTSQDDNAIAMSFSADPLWDENGKLFPRFDELVRNGLSRNSFVNSNRRIIGQINTIRFDREPSVVKQSMVSRMISVFRSIASIG